MPLTDSYQRRRLNAVDALILPPGCIADAPA